MMVETPFFVKGELGEKVLSLVEHHLYNQDIANWTGLEFDLRVVLQGDEVAVQDALRYIREGGI
jgi:hypothetical protein